LANNRPGHDDRGGEYEALREEASEARDWDSEGKDDKLTGLAIGLGPTPEDINMISWMEMLHAALKETGENLEDLVLHIDGDKPSLEFDADKGEKVGAHFTAWGPEWVYFPVAARRYEQQEGFQESIGFTRRDPPKDGSKHFTPHMGN